MKTKKMFPHISSHIQELLNQQISEEHHASQLYLTMATWCDTHGYKGAASLLYSNSNEERQHMLKLMSYLIEVEGQIVMPKNATPQATYSSLHSIFNTAMEQERRVTQLIHSIVDACLKEKDFATFDFLQWFVREQREEESQAQRALELFEIIGKDSIGLYTIDQELGKLAKKEAAIA